MTKAIFEENFSLLFPLSTFITPPSPLKHSEKMKETLKK